MADLNYTVDVNVSSAQQQLSKLQKQVEQLNGAFDKMKSALSGLAFGAMVKEVAAFSDEITDTAAAFGVATSDVLALSAALGASGGKGENAIKIYQGIATSLDELNDGNLKTLKNFEDLGLSLGQLGKMSESEIRDKVITQLGEMDNKTEVAALAMKMFGKAAIGVDFAKLAEEIKNNKQEAEQYAGAIDTAGDAFDNMAKIVKQLKLAFAQAFQPLFKFISEIKVDTDTLSTSFKILAITVLSIGTALGVVRAATIAVTAATAVWNAVSSANPWIAGAKVIIAGLTAAGIITATNTDKQAENNKESEKSEGIVNNTVVKTEELNNKLKQQRDDIIKVGEEYKRNTQNLRNQYDLLVSATHESELQSNISKAKADIETKLQEDLIAQKEKFSKLDLDTQKRTQQDNLNTLYTITKQADEQKRIVESKMTELQISKETSQASLSMSNNLVDMAKDYEKMRTEHEGLLLTTKERLGLEKESKVLLDGISATQQYINNSARLTTDEKKKYLDELAKVTSQEQLLSLLKDEQLDKTGALTTAIRYQMGVTGALIESQQKLTEESRTFSYGWTQAFNEYVNNATNSANRARDIFSSFTSNVNSAIDTLVETGKFKFSDFASSVIKDLIKIELKAATMNLWKSMGGGGGGGGSILSSLGSMLGFANGGNPPIGKASIVGENGPELIVPRTASTVIPNGAGGGQVSNTYITNNISALDAKSVQQLFAENRRALLGSVEAAKREMPGRR